MIYKFPTNKSVHVLWFVTMTTMHSTLYKRQKENCTQQHYNSTYKLIVMTMSLRVVVAAEGVEERSPVGLECNIEHSTLGKGLFMLNDKGLLIMYSTGACAHFVTTVAVEIFDPTKFSLLQKYEIYIL